MRLKCLFTIKLLQLSTILALMFSMQVTISRADELSVAGIYSNMDARDEEDISGMEMFVVLGRGEYFAFVQCAEGDPGKPVLIKIAVDGLKISGSLPEKESPGCQGKSFHGVIDKQGLDIVFDKSQKHIKLASGKSFWISK